METLFALLVPLALVILGGYTATSVKVINQGNEALVERVGKYHRKLKPGLNFITPLLDTIVLEETVREQYVDIPIQRAITKDNVAIEVDAQVYWRIFDLEKAYYAINNLETAIENLVNTTLRSKIGQMKLEDTFSATTDLNKTLLPDLDAITVTWGVKILRVEVQNLSVPQSLLDSMELQRAAEIRKRAAITEAEGTAEAMELIFQTLKSQTNTPPSMSEILKFLVAQKYVEASVDISKSANAKVIFMDPKALTETIGNLIDSVENPSTVTPPTPPKGGNGSGKP